MSSSKKSKKHYDLEYKRRIVDEAGATETLRFVPTEEAVMEKVVSMYDRRKKE